MSKKKIKGDGIFFGGKSSEDVAGSQYLIKFGETQCLLECGLYQSKSNDYLDSYKINSEKFKFTPSDLQYVFACHTHIDHVGLIPRLVHEGFSGDIIVTPDTAKIMKPLLLNSCAIIQDEARILSKKYRRQYKPLYEEEDVYRTLSLVKVFEDYDKEYILDNGISFHWIHNTHCLGATQLLLTLKNDNKVKRVLYTSDIGALNACNHYVSVTNIPSEYVDVAIMESTYGEKQRNTKKKRSFDLKNLETAVDTVLDRRGTVIIPCFSFSRTQEILTVLYELYGSNEHFKAPVIVDSKLSCDISDLYLDILKGENYQKWEQIYNWKNLKFVTDKSDSQSWVANSVPKIVISSSGFCTNGRVVNYLQRYLRDENSMVIFSGYTGDNSSYLSYRIKNYRDNHFIKINKEQVPNKADCLSLHTFSSHAGFDDLIEYGSSLNTNKLVLVHGSSEAKKQLAEGLREAISKKNKTFRVIESHKDMMVRL